MSRPFSFVLTLQIYHFILSPWNTKRLFEVFKMENFFKSEKNIQQIYSLMKCNHLYIY